MEFRGEGMGRHINFGICNSFSFNRKLEKKFLNIFYDYHESSINSLIILEREMGFKISQGFPNLSVILFLLRKFLVIGL